MLLLWNSVRGYVKIQIKGLSLERFLNAATENDLRFYDVEWIDAKTLCAWIDAKTYTEIRPLLRSLHVHTRVLERQGLPFKLRKWKGRWMLLAGGVLCCVALTFLSQRLWDIRISGNESIATDSILNTAKRQARIGMSMSELDLDSLKSLVERSDERIAWVGAHKNGTCLTIHIVEGDLLEKAEIDDTFTHIVASKDATVDEITVIRGYAHVQPGQQIKEGDILISGAMPANQETGERYVRAQGEVLGKNWYTGEAQVSRETADAFLTGKSEKVKTMFIGRQKIEIDGKFETFEAENRQRTGVDYLYLPLEILSETHYETQMKKNRLTDEEMKERAESISLQKALESVPKDARILSQDSSFNLSEEGNMRALTIIETLENIGSAVHFEAPEPEEENTEEKENNP